MLGETPRCRAASMSACLSPLSKLENERTLEAYGRGSYIGTILEIHQDEPGRTHVVLIRRPVGF